MEDKSIKIIEEIKNQYDIRTASNPEWGGWVKKSNSVLCYSQSNIEY